jgi:Killing trait
MADTVAPMITDADAEMPPYAQLLADLTLIGPNRSTAMLDLHDSNSTLASDATTNALVLGAAPGQAVAVGYQSLAHSLSLLMLGDTNAHSAFASTSAAIVTTTVSMLLGHAGETP